MYAICLTVPENASLQSESECCGTQPNGAKCTITGLFLNIGKLKVLKKKCR